VQYGSNLTFRGGGGVCLVSPDLRPSHTTGLMFAVLAAGDLLSSAFAVKQVSGRSMQVRKAVFPSWLYELTNFEEADVKS